MYSHCAPWPGLSFFLFSSRRMCESRINVIIVLRQYSWFDCYFRSQLFGIAVPSSKGRSVKQRKKPAFSVLKTAGFSLATVVRNDKFHEFGFLP